MMTAHQTPPPPYPPSAAAAGHDDDDDDGRRSTDAAAVTADARGVDNVAFFRPGGDGPPAAAFANGGRQTGPDRHQLPPSALTPAQFEMSYGTLATATAAADDMSSRDNLLAPRGQ